MDGWYPCGPWGDVRYRAPYSANNLIQELVGGASTPGGERVGSQAGLL